MYLVYWLCVAIFVVALFVARAGALGPRESTRRRAGVVIRMGMVNFSGGGAMT